MKHFKLTKSQLAYLSKPILKAERTDDAIVWLILSLVSLSGIGYWAWTVMK